MVMFTNPPAVTAGDHWSEVEIQTYIVDNLLALHALIGGGSPVPYPANAVLVGSAQNTIATLVLALGSLVVGGATAPVALAVGTDNQVLVSDGGTLSWETLDVSVSRADIVKLGV